MVLSIFSCACWPFVYLLLGNTHLGFLHIFYMSCIYSYFLFNYILDTSHLSEYILPVVACDFISLTVSVEEQSAEILMKSGLSIFPFYN